MITLEQRNKAVTELYKLNIPKVVWKFKYSSETFNDFSQYCYLQLLTMDDDTFEKLIDHDALDDYFFILCKRQAATGSHFWREHSEKLNMISIDETPDIFE